MIRWNSEDFGIESLTLKRRLAMLGLSFLKAPVAQLDRAFGYEPKGRTFESCRAHNKINSLRQVRRLPFFICDNLVTIVLRIALSHSRDGVALAGIARM